MSLRDSEFETVGLGEFVSLCRDAGLKDLVELGCHGNGGIELVFVETPLDEQRLETLECVSRWERVNETKNIFLIEFEVPDLLDTLAMDVEELVCEPSVTEQGCRVIIGGLLQCHLWNVDRVRTDWHERHTPQTQRIRRTPPVPWRGDQPTTRGPSDGTRDGVLRSAPAGIDNRHCRGTRG